MARGVPLFDGGVAVVVVHFETDTPAAECTQGETGEVEVGSGFGLRSAMGEGDSSLTKEVGGLSGFEIELLEEWLWWSAEVGLGEGLHSNLALVLEAIKLVVVDLSLSREKSLSRASLALLRATEASRARFSASERAEEAALFMEEEARRAAASRTLAADKSILNSFTSGEEEEGGEREKREVRRRAGRALVGRRVRVRRKAREVGNGGALVAEEALVRGRRLVVVIDEEADGAEVAGVVLEDAGRAKTPVASPVLDVVQEVPLFLRTLPAFLPSLPSLHLSPSLDLIRDSIPPPNGNPRQKNNCG
ncbi:hypothetical protein RJ641_020931 [Dillenia turbinata]|uniref:Uncharacterized protein n=1 Tax=Dillenia turbinata TaxID=194707 RepID=A0AAN8UDU5_9MAGN